MKIASNKNLFEYLLNKTSRIDEGCWLWTHNVYNAKKYKQARAFGRAIYAHRLSCLMFNGHIPTGLCVCHKCDNPICVNPEHLFLGTAQDNIDDMMKKGRGAGQFNRLPPRKLCKRGHEWINNTVKFKNGTTKCRECMRIATNKHDKKRRPSKCQKQKQLNQ